MRILVIEDERKLADYLKKGLENHSYSVDCVYDGETGEKRAAMGEYDAVILDLMLPVRDGIEVTKSLRARGINVPILMLTARGELEDKILGLDSGADDYLVKPFEFQELLARIRALLRRPTAKVGEELKARDITVYPNKYLIEQDGKKLDLTLKEYAVLEYLVRHKGEVLNREQIFDHCWDWTVDSFSNVVDVYIKKLRDKLNDKNEKYIRTVRGVGYQFQE
jgi:DNA-binding response OmpR family regulator